MIRNPDRYIGEIGWAARTSNQFNPNSFNVTSIKYGNVTLPSPAPSQYNFQQYYLIDSPYLFRTFNSQLKINLVNGSYPVYDVPIFSQPVLPYVAFQAYAKAIGAAKTGKPLAENIFDEYRITPEQYRNLENLNFNFGGGQLSSIRTIRVTHSSQSYVVTIPITKQSQAYPRNVTNATGGQYTVYILQFTAALALEPNSYLEPIPLGPIFLDHAYVVYDVRVASVFFSAPSNFV